MEALERHPRKLAVPYGCRQVTALGMERFAKEAKRLQKNKELSMDLEIVAYFCGWTDDHLAPLGRVCLAALDIDGGTDLGEAIVDADLLIIDNGAGGTNRKVLASRLKTYAGGEDPVAMAIALG